MFHLLRRSLRSHQSPLSISQLPSYLTSRDSVTLRPKLLLVPQHLYLSLRSVLLRRSSSLRYFQIQTLATEPESFSEEFMLASLRSRSHAAFVVFFCLSLCLLAHAQSNSESISGTVLDPRVLLFQMQLLRFTTRLAPLTDQRSPTAPDSSASQTFHSIPTT